VEVSGFVAVHVSALHVVTALWLVVTAQNQVVQLSHVHDDDDDDIL
jgi:hypothetical protein